MIHKIKKIYRKARLAHLTIIIKIAIIKIESDSIKVQNMRIIREISLKNKCTLSSTLCLKDGKY